MIGMLWGDFPWEVPPPKLGKLLSSGTVARNIAQALRAVGTVVPYTPPDRAAPEAERAALEAFLRSIDLLWADLYPGSAAALELRHELRLPCSAILFAGGTLPKGAEAMLFPWQELLRPDDGLLFSCRADHEIWRRLVRWSVLHEWVLPLPVDMSVFYPRDPADHGATRARYGLPTAAPLLLYAGRLNIQKNLHTLLRLLAAVRRQAPDAHLCLVGEEDDIVLGEFGVRNTGYVEWLRAMAADLGVERAITFVEPLFGASLAELYAAADVVVNASFYHRENFGLSQAEAQACGVPVVCTAWGGFKDVVLHGETGYLMDTVLTKHGVRVDWAAGARYVTKLIEDTALRERMGTRAIEWARERFRLDAVSRALAGVVATAMRQPAAAAVAGQAVPAAAYDPSVFARRYEAHKRACGWYAPSVDPDGQSHWYPRMFQGRDYALYETLMVPYATRLAGDIVPSTICPEWVPYSPSPIVLDPTRRIAHDTDAVWPHQRWLSTAEWEVLLRVDGTTTVGKLAANIADGSAGLDLSEVVAALWHLHVEGFVIFDTQEVSTA